MRLLSLFLCLSVVGCGGVDDGSSDTDDDQEELKPKEGEGCYSPGALTCDDADTALSCENGRYLAIQCRGEGGCVTNGTNTVCLNGTNAIAGDHCTSSQEQLVECDSFDANKALRCTSNIFVSETCKGCLVSGGNVYCAP